MDRDTRDYFFALLKDASPESVGYILTSLYGYLEGCSFNGDHEGLLFLMNKIQVHSDFDFGIR
jgi:hypothetical protein